MNGKANELKRLQKARQELAKERRRLKKELELKHELQKQHKEITELKEQLHPSAKSKLQKFLLTTSKAIEQLGKGVKMVSKTQQPSKPKVRIKRAKPRRKSQSLLDRI